MFVVSIFLLCAISIDAQVAPWPVGGHDPQLSFRSTNDIGCLSTAVVIWKASLPLANSLDVLIPSSGLVWWERGLFFAANGSLVSSVTLSSGADFFEFDNDGKTLIAVTFPSSTTLSVVTRDIRYVKQQHILQNVQEKLVRRAMSLVVEFLGKIIIWNWMILTKNSATQHIRKSHQLLSVPHSPQLLWTQSFSTISGAAEIVIDNQNRFIFLINSPSESGGLLITYALSTGSHVWNLTMSSNPVALRQSPDGTVIMSALDPNSGNITTYFLDPLSGAQKFTLPGLVDIVTDQDYAILETAPGGVLTLTAFSSTGKLLWTSGYSYM